jgi:nitrite reductase/ring-hydroxylating ferredoxin subunit
MRAWNPLPARSGGDPSPSPDDEPGDCRACGTCTGRREFLRTSLGLAALSTLAALLPRGAGAEAIRRTHSTGGAGGEVRYPVPASTGVEVDRDHEVILVRDGTTVTAFALSCPHQRSMLRWRDNKGIFQCTKHHSEYNLDGVYQKGRATRNMDRLAIRLEGGEVVVDPSVAYHSDEDPAGWNAAAVQVG